MTRYIHAGLLTAGAAAALLASPIAAQTITNGFTFAVASGSNTSVGTHFHSSTGGDFGNPSGKAEVGRYSTEEVRGLSEYSLAGLSAADTAFVTFNTFKAGGLFGGANDTPFTGSISVFAYEGNNTENISDYSATPFASIGSFAVGPTVSVGDIFSFDITSAFNFALTNGYSSLGIRLQAVPLNTASQAWTFDTFRLTSDDQSTNPPSVPEPASWALMVMGFGLIGSTLRQRRTVVSYS